MQAWRGWPLERLLYVFFAVAMLVVWAQVYLFHGVLGNFHASPQYGPVIYTPLLVVAALLYAAARNAFTRDLYLVLYVGGVIVGLFGVYFHYQGVAEMPGGVTLENLAAGPPVLLPVVYMAVSALALLVAWWPRKLPVDAPELSATHAPGMPATHLR